jgi:imidazolonepropionase
LLTLRGPKGPRRGPALADLGIIADGAVLIRDGVIVEVGPTRRIENLAAARGAHEIAAHGRVVMPGFVDSHTHLIYPPRGVRSADVAGAARVWQASSVRLLAARSRVFLDAMARHGTTTVEVKTGCDPGEAAVMKALRVGNLLREEPVEVVPTHLVHVPAGSTAEEVEELLMEVTPRILRRGLAAFADIWWEGGEPRAELCARFLEQATACGVGVKVHAAGPGCAGAVALAVGHRAVTVDHLEHLTLDLVPLLAEAHTIATLMPGAALDAWTPLAPARCLIDSGAAVALASNFNPHHSPTLNMQTVVALASMRMGMSAAEAISAATINGAHALERGDRVGSLELGKRADLLLLNVDDYRDVARSLGLNLVHLTLKAGSAIYREGAVLRAS